MRYVQTAGINVMRYNEDNDPALHRQNPKIQLLMEKKKKSGDRYVHQGKRGVSAVGQGEAGGQVVHVKIFIVLCNIALTESMRNMVRYIHTEKLENDQKKR